MTIISLRSLLFVPGDNASRIVKAAASSADAVIIDLEDAVAPGSKKAARDALKSSVELIRSHGKYVVVRINGVGEMLDADLYAAGIARADALMVPKVDSVAILAEVGKAYTAQVELKKLEMPGVIALIESAKGVLSAAEIATAPGVLALALGSEDFALSLGVKPNPANLDLPVATIALAAHACGVAAYAMPASIGAFRDVEATRTAAAKARNYGCHGALCIHPLQVEVVNEAFQPSLEEIAEAEDCLKAWKQAEIKGQGVVVAGNRMVDAPVVAWARDVLRRASIV